MDIGRGKRSFFRAFGGRQRTIFKRGQQKTELLRLALNQGQAYSQIFSAQAKLVTFVQPFGPEAE
ncbi:MAG TPA: hypothetical protein VF898_12050 [Chloroflexota bacterium]